jgi:hypothetical protein
MNRVEKERISREAVSKMLGLQEPKISDYFIPHAGVQPEIPVASVTIEYDGNLKKVEEYLSQETQGKFQGQSPEWEKLKTDLRSVHQTKNADPKELFKFEPSKKKIKRNNLAFWFLLVAFMLVTGSNVQEEWIKEVNDPPATKSIAVQQTPPQGGPGGGQQLSPQEIEERLIEAYGMIDPQGRTNDLEKFNDLMQAIPAFGARMENYPGTLQDPTGLYNWLRKANQELNGEGLEKVSEETLNGLHKTFPRAKEKADKAQASSKYGGIDFDDKYLQLNMQGNVMELAVPDGFDWLLQRPIQGFEPRIIDIRSGVGSKLSFLKGVIVPD